MIISIFNNLELIITESIYFISVIALCLTIVFKTREIYKLTKHRGINNFRNIFKYFALSYFFRIIQIIILLLKDSLSLMTLLIISGANLFLISYMSTLALFSIFFTISNRLTRNQELIFKILAFGISIMAFLTLSIEFITIIQLLTTIVIVITLLKSKKSKLLTKMKIIYLLLILFWIINLLFVSSFSFQTIFRTPTYMISLILLFLIEQRVKKRLDFDEKKK